jgi:hypothetical protein
MTLKTGRKASKTPSGLGLKPAKKKPSPKVSSPQSTERELHMHCWQWVTNAYPHLLIFHVPNGEIRDRQTARKLQHMGVVPGVADFLLFIRGLAVAIELKRLGGTQSDAQVDFQVQWENVGNHYIIVYSLEDFKNVVGRYALPWFTRSEPTNPTP